MAFFLAALRAGWIYTRARAGHTASTSGSSVPIGARYTEARSPRTSSVDGIPYPSCMARGSIGGLRQSRRTRPCARIWRAAVNRCRATRHSRRYAAQTARAPAASACSHPRTPVPSPLALVPASGREATARRRCSHASNQQRGTGRVRRPPAAAFVLRALLMSNARREDVGRSVSEILEPLGVASLGLPTTDADHIKTLRAGLERADYCRSDAQHVPH